MSKRLLDIVVSASLLLLTLPVLIVITIGSAIALGAWPFFTQERIGYQGARFKFIKVRTLRPDVPAYIDKHQLDEARIPMFCRMLRRLHLDELPQLLLVLRGTMSLVGPRPEMAYLHEQLPPGFRELRTSVLPGCTGLWQISSACTDLISASPEYDHLYVAHRSLRLDVAILARTALKMVGRWRPVTLDRLPRALDVPRVLPHAALQSTSR